MSLNIQDVAASWGTDEPKYKELGTVVSTFIKTKITEFEILPEVSFRTKDLLSIVKKLKKKQREKSYSYSDLRDKLGLRIICTFQEDMTKVDTFLRTYFLVDKVEYKQDGIDFDKLAYISNHYDLTINVKTKEFKKIDKYKDMIFEVQVRTLNQHAWSNTAHTLSYKQEADLSSSLKRKIYRLLSLYEIADDEFSSVNEALINLPDNEVYKLLRKLESKIYKFAQVDYDRDTSFYNLKILLSYFSAEETKDIFASIDNFIVSNTQRVQRIFNENRLRFFEIPLLTQPEVFLIWYALEHYSFTIEENWPSDFDFFELEQLSTLWGKLID